MSSNEAEQLSCRFDSRSAKNLKFWWYIFFYLW